MILFGSSPDQIAQQNLAYDQMYGRANEVNASNDYQARLKNFTMAMDQQNAAQDAADKQAATLQDQSWRSGENVLDRQSKLADSQAKYGSDTQNQLDFREALRLAQNGAVTPDKEGITALYPHFDNSQRDQIFQTAGAASVAKAQAAATQQDHNGTGSPPDADSIIKAAGVPAGTPFEDQVRAFVTSLRQPYEQDYTKEADVANAGNAAAKSAALETPMPPENSWGHFARMILGNAVSPDNVIVGPSPEAADRLSKLASAASTAATATKTTPATIQGAPGSYTPIAPSTWRPAFAPASAVPLTATAPAMPVQAPAAQAPVQAAAVIPPAPPPSQRVVGQKYRGSKGLVGIWNGTGWTPVPQ